MKKLTILLIEDDNDDIELLQDALDSQQVSYQMHVIKDGGRVAAYLDSCDPVPDIIVMDFNLPKVHGREILKHVKQNNRFNHTPVLILTTSSSQDDIDYSYKQGASRYLIKPTTTDGIRSVIEVIADLTK